MPWLRDGRQKHQIIERKQDDNEGCSRLVSRREMQDAEVTRPLQYIQDHNTWESWVGTLGWDVGLGHWDIKGNKIAWHHSGTMREYQCVVGSNPRSL